MTPVPVLVVSGFLGAGKTTLINHLLAHRPAAERVGVIVNDFGRINIDGKTLGPRADRVVELSGGCICCSLQAGLTEAVQALAARADLDRIIVEASGISSLSALLRTLAGEGGPEGIRLAQVAAVVDARRYLRALQRLPVIADQIAHARFIVLNHGDEVAAPDIDATVARLQQLRPEAPIVVTRRGQVAWDELWADTPAGLDRSEPEHHHHHHESWLAYEIGLPSRLDPPQVLEALDRLPAAIERVKGFAANGGELLLFEKVGAQRATVERCTQPVPAGSTNVLVVLARTPVDDALRRAFGSWATVAPLPD